MFKMGWLASFAGMRTIEGGELGADISNVESVDVKLLLFADFFFFFFFLLEGVDRHC